MIAFGEVGRRIVGKPVQQVLRTSRSANDTPPDIAAIVSLKFTLAVTLTEQSYYNPQKSYQVNSVITAYGRQHALPHTRHDQHKHTTSSQMPPHALTYPTSSSTDLASQTLNYPMTSYSTPPNPTIPYRSANISPSSAPEIQTAAQKTIPRDITPPPPLDHDETPSKKTALTHDVASSKHSIAQKRLFQDTMDTAKEDSSTPKKTKNDTSKAAASAPLSLAIQQIASQQPTSGATKMPDLEPPDAQKNK
ncbi:uncharacterized protein LOC133930035 isoform X3 [Phragmites australis]|uniref:uncharacterized protein LOC133930035 isoform X3 n=1 Tax=Phragmites australis TaxID=29695 RepID=UPI002D77DC48|nr:uncharacterized protein LOC133930035 isoform X3 [Phragmites australis]